MLFTRMCVCLRESVMVSRMNPDDSLSLSCFSRSTLALSPLSTLPTLCISSVTLYSLSILLITSLSLSFMFQNNYAESTGWPRRFGLGEAVFSGKKSNRPRVFDVGSVFERRQGLCSSGMSAHAWCWSCWSPVSTTMQVQDGNQHRAHGCCAGERHVQRQEADGVSQRPHTVRRPEDDIEGEPCTGMEQWNSVSIPPKLRRNESFVRNESPENPAAYVYAAEVGTGELRECSTEHE